MIMRTRILSIAIAFAFSAGISAVQAQSSKTVVDPRKNCQLTVPADWTVDGATGYAPGKKISAALNGVGGRSFADAKTFVKGGYHPVKVIQDDAKRLLYSFDPGIMGAGKSGWYEVIASTPTCAASFMYAPGTDEALLRKVVDSLAAVKK
jgi:hypothetical protein